MPVRVAGVGSGGRFRKVPEGSGEFRCVLKKVPGVGSGRFRRIPVISGACWCRFPRQVRERSGVCAGVSSGGLFRQVPEGSGDFRCVLV